jgi:hypothetical protein
VILIAITLIAAIAIAGFVFGLFGSFTSSAQISASVVTCSWTSPSITCNLSLNNSGTSNTTGTVCSMTTGGKTYAGVAAVTGGIITAGTSTTATCIATAPDPGAGVAIVGSLATSNGASVPFTGTSNN